jgi:hypothetical protein
MTPEEELDGIHIYGNDIVDMVSGVKGIGTLRVPSGPAAQGFTIGGSANKAHLYGPFADLMKAVTGDLLYGNIKDLLCDDHDPKDGLCLHFNFRVGGWITGSYGAG